MWSRGKGYVYVPTGILLAILYVCKNLHIIYFPLYNKCNKYIILICVQRINKRVQMVKMSCHVYELRIYTYEDVNRWREWVYLGLHSSLHIYSSLSILCIYQPNFHLNISKIQII